MFLDKRKRFVFSAVTLSLLLYCVQLLSSQQYKFIAIAVLGMLSLLAFWWSLKDGLKTTISYLILVLPFYYTVSVALFWFLLPGSKFSEIILTIIYGISIYILFLTTNVFSVSSIKTIALYRAAKGVGFLLSLTAFFLTFDGLMSLKLSYVYLGICVFILSFPLYLQGFWTSTLQERFNKKIIFLTMISSFLQAQLSVILFFWPVGIVVGSLFMTIYFYIILGLGQNELEGRLFFQTVREYLMVGIVVFIVMLFSASWTGY